MGIYSYENPIQFNKLIQSYANQEVNTGLKLNKDLLKLKITTPDIKTPTIDTTKLPTNLEFPTKKVSGGISPSTYGIISGVLNTGIGMVGGQLDHTSTANQVLGMAGDVAAMIPGPYGMAISAGLKGVQALDRLTGKSAKEQLTTGESATGYSLDVNTNAGTTYGGLFGNKARRKTDKLTKVYEKSNISKLIASKTAEEQNIAANNLLGFILNKNTNALQGGVDTSMLAARSGLKLDYLPNIRNIIKQRKSTEIVSNFESSIKELKNGGPVNVIPSGALHKELNHLGLDTTKKGIPVVTMDDGGEITSQRAEIEREEIILHLNLTEKLEKLREQYEESNDVSFAIQAGKLLAEEIIENTEDNTGLLTTV